MRERGKSTLPANQHPPISRLLHFLLDALLLLSVLQGCLNLADNLLQLRRRFTPLLPGRRISREGLQRSAQLLGLAAMQLCKALLLHHQSRDELTRLANGFAPVGRRPRVFQGFALGLLVDGFREMVGEVDESWHCGGRKSHVLLATIEDSGGR
ncbi:hypothetical protein B0H16DRAFT_1501855 [Mycena metata]|uniref:Uncharacterized protein n=1 Tax=Mycena metata TaxID=1033252 RepID=A0AAD7K881_9AGAR|nr:hypothetical protein B0H16DRAFT_1501855 [Mycena metata]